MSDPTAKYREPPLVYTVPEAAARLGISVWLARRLVRAGKIPALKLGDRRVVVPRARLEAFLAAGSDGDVA